MLRYAHAIDASYNLRILAHPGKMIQFRGLGIRGLLQTGSVDLVG